MGGAGYELSTWRGSAAALHARRVPAPAPRAVWLLDVAAPALVLGSTQPASAADTAAAGVPVVTRRSGGGAVLVVPGELVWFDVIVPAGDLRAAGVSDDVARSMVWLGSRVREALTALGAAESLTVHDGPMCTGAWARAVCFDGVAPGEITTPRGKLVGISQRRTREWARFQCAVHVRWDPERLVALLARPRPSADELAPVATLPAETAAALPAAVVAALSRCARPNCP